MATKIETQHIVPNLNGGWSLKKSGSTRATKNFTEKSEAIKVGKIVARNQKTVLVVHKSDGRIERIDRSSTNSNKLKGKR